VALALSDIRTRLQDLYGNTLSSEDTFYNRIINDAYQKLCALADWWWLEDYTVLRFSAPVTTENFDCTIATADIVSSAAADTVTTAMVTGWAVTGNHTYRITTIDSASHPQTITLDANFIEASTVYAMKFWNDTITLPTAFDHAVQVVPRKDPNTKPLRHVDLAEIEGYGPDLSAQETDIAQVYSIYKEATIDADQFRMRIFPPPDVTAEYVLRFVQTPVNMANDADEPALPLKHQSVIADMARLELLKVTGANQDEIQTWEGEALKGLQRMFADQVKKGNMQRAFGRRGSADTKTIPWKLTNYTVGDPI
jgi:hypothetical protein